jgi:Bacterial Ig-like domain (group 2)
MSNMFESLRRWWNSERSSHRRIELTTDSKDPVVVQFCSEVNRASTLLDFLMEEGHPYHIPDQIIDRIEEAREFVKAGTPPTAAQRAALLKAYRDLVAIPGTAVLFDFPPAPFWRSHWRQALIVLLGLSAIACMIIAFVREWHEFWYWPVGFALVSLVTICGLYVFTGIVTNRKLNQIITFCYVFTGLVLVMSTLPWTLPMLYSADIVGKAPVGILRACGAETGRPPGVTCEGDRYQWVLNIGGAIEERPEKKEGEKPPSLVPSGVKVYVVRGGVVVPLYVIVLALVGGAVSMTRRVPEYQRRSMSAQDPFTNQEARENLVFQIMQVLSAPLIAIVAYYIVHPTNDMWAVVLGFGSGFASEPILLMIRGLVEKLSPAPPERVAPVRIRVDPAATVMKPGGSQQFTAHVSGLPSTEVTWLIVPSDAGSISQSGYYTAPKDRELTVTITASSVADRTKSGSASVTIKQGDAASPAGSLP